MNDYCDTTDGYMEDISKALATTASIFNYTYPSGSAKNIIEEHSIISQKITKLENDLVNHELYTIISEGKFTQSTGWAIIDLLLFTKYNEFKRVIGIEAIKERFSYGCIF